MIIIIVRIAIEILHPIPKPKISLPYKIKTNDLPFHTYTMAIQNVLITNNIPSPPLANASVTSPATSLKRTPVTVGII